MEDVNMNCFRASSVHGLITDGLAICVRVAVIGHQRDGATRRAEKKEDYTTKKRWFLAHIADGFDDEGEGEDDRPDDPEKTPFDEAMRRLRDFIVPLVITDACVVVTNAKGEVELRDFSVKVLKAVKKALALFDIEVRVRRHDEENVWELKITPDGEIKDNKEGE